MGKKAKIGKGRKDKFYHLAKETGYRARSAFKLVQLNRKYNFLQSSRVLIDLCAAPGGWLQVAAKSMPMSSLIVGVDLVPIKPIPNVVAIQEDITSSKCKQLIQRELKNWKADCVLNDGAPNVGAAWVQDAFSQAELSLAALKLACSFLREGGWFISKIFRSKDYQPLMWVLNQLFKKVHSTKPHASRIESAEIFVVCSGYLAPSVLDEKLLDPKHVFQEVEVEKDSENNMNLVKLQKVSKAAEGYPDDARVLFQAKPVADFVMEENYLSILRDTNQFLFDRTSEVFSRHPLTTEEIRESFKDIKVLGPKELKNLIKWRAKMKAFLEEVGSEGEGEAMEEGGKEDGEEEELAGIDSKVKDLEAKEAAEVKREIRHLRKRRKKLKERLVVKGVDEESGELIRQEHLFQLKAIKTQCQLDNVVEGEGLERDPEEEESGSEGEISGDDPSAEEEEEEEEDDNDGEGKGSSASCDDNTENENSDDEDDVSSDDDGDDDDGGDDGAELTQQQDNPLVVSFDNASDIRSKKAKQWFSKPIFEKLQSEQEEDTELQMMMKNYEKKGGQVLTREGKGKKEASSKTDKNGRTDIDIEKKKKQNDGKNDRTDIEKKKGKKKPNDGKNGREKKKKQNNGKKVRFDDEMDHDGDKNKEEITEAPPPPPPGSGRNSKTTEDMSSDDNTSSSDDDDDDFDALKQGNKLSNEVSGGGTVKKSSKDSFEIVSINPNKRKLDPEGLALGALLSQSKKKREDLVESGYNRWTNNDKNLPDWFVESEAKFCQKRLPVTKEMVEVYRAKLKEINARPIKKVAEAKARKKKRVLKSMEKARKKSESIVDSEDVSSQEKAQQLKQIYKKAGVFGNKKKKEKVEYVVAKRGMGKKVHRPAGVKGRYKVVDPRMKKDTLGKAKDRMQRAGGGKKREKGKQKQKGGRGGGKRKR